MSRLPCGHAATSLRSTGCAQCRRNAKGAAYQDCGHKMTSFKAGRCVACEMSKRYRDDPEYRELAKDRSRKQWHKQQRVLTEDQKAAKRQRARERYRQDPRPAQSTELKRKFGITLDEYEVMLAKQVGACAICGRSATEFQRRLAVDHDHETGQIRSLLCQACNTGLGNFADSPELLSRASSYLLKWREVAA